eukprot:GEMP01034648.1.p1 GENE.GEMP01034648.1~~GEMP01034648.1.p1  ORF type:complete len:519 (+),score=142.02 GEMP01034648.1:259-1815(+)
MTKPCTTGRRIRGSTVAYGGCLLRSLTAKARKELPFGGDLRVAERQRTLDNKCGADLLFRVMCSLQKVILDPDIRSVFVLAYRLVFPFVDDPTQAAWVTFHRRDFPAASRCGAQGCLVQPFRDRAHIDNFCAARDVQCEYALASENVQNANISEQFAEAAECAFHLAPRCESRYSAHYVFGELLWHALQNCGEGKSKVRRLVLLLDKSSTFLRSVGMRHLRWLNTLSILFKAEQALQAYVCAVALGGASPANGAAMTTDTVAARENENVHALWTRWNPEVEELCKRARRVGVEGLDVRTEDGEITVKEMFRPRCKKRTRGGARAEYIGYGTQSVESVVLARYVPSEFENGVHCEGRMLSRIFCILFEDLLVEFGKYSSAYEVAPLALLDGSFQQHPKVRAFLASLASWSFEELAQAVERAVVFIPDGAPLPPSAEELESVDLASLDAESMAQHNVERTENGWNFRPPVMQCCPCIGGTMLSKIFDRMMVALYERWTTGFAAVGHHTAASCIRRSKKRK